MLSIVANIFYVLTAIAMIVLILLQRGSGAAAGSGFGGGASATVFGARGSANFMSRSTAVLAGLFFLLSLGMGMYATRAGLQPVATDDLGVMSGVATQATPAATPAPSSTGEVPQPEAATAAPVETPEHAASESAEKPAATGDVPAAEAPKDGGKDGK